MKTEDDLRRVADPLVGRLVWIRFAVDPAPLLARIEGRVTPRGALRFARVDPITHVAMEPMFCFAADQIVSIQAAGEA